MNSNDQYRQALSQGMTPCEAEQEVAEAEEYERVEREMEAREAKLRHDAVAFGRKPPLTEKEYYAALRELLS